MPNPPIRLSIALLLPCLVACQPSTSASAPAGPATQASANPVSPTARDGAGDADSARQIGRDTISDAVRAHAHGVEVEGSGTVLRVLADDTEGSPHQRFLLALPGGDTVLVAHNVDLASRLDGLASGDTVEFRGEYIWNPKGGTLHWTHRDPHGGHPGGWLRWRGRVYE